MYLLSILAQQTQPTAVPLPGNAQTVINNVLGYIMTLGGVVAVGAIMIIALRVMAGFRRNGQMAADALGSLPYVLVGGILLSSAAALANQIL